MKQGQLNFSDYSAKEQEQDAQRHKTQKEQYFKREVYVMRVNGEWGAVMPKRRYNVIFNADAGVELVEFVQKVKADLEELGIKPHFHCVQNFGIESKIAEHQMTIRKLNSGR